MKLSTTCGALMVAAGCSGLLATSLVTKSGPLPKLVASQRSAASGTTVPSPAPGAPGPSSGAARPRPDGGPACPPSLSPSAPVNPPGGAPFTVCTGKLPSFDGTPIDTDVSIPEGPSAPRPLVVMLHGWGDSKTQFESTTLAAGGENTYDWNNAWFASKGYAVLTYSARGFDESCGQDPSAGYSYASDPACAGRASWTHLADRRWEVHDAQYLVGLLVDAGVAKPSEIVVTGDSYGGGQSWMLALSQDEVMQSDGSVAPWTSPRGVPIHLAAAVPQYPWADLVQALFDNGRASDGYFGAPGDGSHAAPIGVKKESIVDGLYALGESTAQYPVPGTDSSADLPAWFAAASAGEPYSADPVASQGIAELVDHRSPLYMAVPPRRAAVPVLDLQGVQDQIFPAIQALELVNRLNAAEPGYPVWTVLGDLGHTYSSNPHALWVEVNGDANRWLSSVLAGGQPDLPHFTVLTVSCDAATPAATYQADRFTQLDSRVVTLSDSTPQSTSSLTPPGPEAAATDPAEGYSTVGSLDAEAGPCVRMNQGTDPGVASWTFTPPAVPAGTVIGSPIVHVGYALVGADAEVSARLWDVDPAKGTQTLVTRAVYRFSPGSPRSSGDISFELWPTAWTLAAGHELELELTQVDAPTWRPDNVPSSIQWSGLSLRLPMR